MNRIKKYFKNFVVTMHLKGGSTIVFKCKTFDIKSKGNELTAYKSTGMKMDFSMLYVRIDDISAITYKEVWF